VEEQDDDAVIIVDLPEEQGQQQNNFLHKRDGERSKNRGPCPCGYRHWCDGKEYDFVFQWPGINALGGFNISDNAFTVAEEYVTKYHRSSKWDHRHIVNQIAHAIMRQTEPSSHDVVKPSSEKTSNFDPFKEDYNVPEKGTTRYNKVTGQFEKTFYPLNESRTPEEEAEIKRKQAIIEENQKKLMREKEEEEKRREGIVDIIRRDRLERDTEETKHVEYKSLNTTGKIAKLEGGVVVWVDPPQMKIPKSAVSAPTVRSITDLSHDYPHHHHLPISDSDDEEEDEIEKLSRLPKIFWNDHIFLKLLSKHGEAVTKKVMLTVGFGESELEEILFKGNEHLKRHKKIKVKDNKPNGFRLGNAEEKSPPQSPSPISSPPQTHSASTPSFTVDIDSPTTTIKIRLIDGSTKEVTANLTHTISDIIDYIRCITGVSEFKLVNTAAWPRKTLTELNLTIKQANLSNTNLTQTPF